MSADHFQGLDKVNSKDLIRSFWTTTTCTCCSSISSFVMSVFERMLSKRFGISFKVKTKLFRHPQAYSGNRKPC